MGQLLTEHVKFDVQQTMCIVVVTLGGGVNEVWISLDKKAAFNMELLVCLNIVCVCFLMLSQIRWAHTSIAHLVCRRTVVFKL